MCLTDLSPCDRAFHAKSSNRSDFRIHGSTPSQCPLPVSGSIAFFCVGSQDQVCGVLVTRESTGRTYGSGPRAEIILAISRWMVYRQVMDSSECFMLPTSRDTFPVPWRPNRTALPAVSLCPQEDQTTGGITRVSPGSVFGNSGVVWWPCHYCMCGWLGAQNELHICRKCL